jgi:polyphosphate kinase 2 (PPK2 family)
MTEDQSIAARIMRNGKSRPPGARPVPARNHGKLKRKDYEKQLRKLQVELCRLQEWVKYKGLRVIILFEGRDAAGKGGTIKALTEKV